MRGGQSVCGAAEEGEEGCVWWLWCDPEQYIHVCLSGVGSNPGGTK